MANKPVTFTLKFNENKTFVKGFIEHRLQR